MIDQHLFYEAHVDTQDNYFLLSDQAYEEYRSARLEYYEKKKIHGKRAGRTQSICRVPETDR